MAPRLHPRQNAKFKDLTPETCERFKDEIEAASARRVKSGRAGGPRRDTSIAKSA